MGVAVKDRRAFRKLQELCCALAYWCPLFAEVSYLPSLVYPFVRLLSVGGGDGAVAAFELVLMLLTNPCTRWFELFPNAPVPHLQSLDAALRTADPQLHK